ncbi:vacuolar protein sorting-associated protein [Corchorus olitorius]|uniref:Vacuolar protein sorting-associated protein n=1 Tax=Corchorus olitorius TaxID=93759 RepID=A0A1R3KXG4_9ROSI|nr:vacuolar protein sorting-associated protein [Corchorus olitorius]
MWLPRHLLLDKIGEMDGLDSILQCFGFLLETAPIHVETLGFRNCSCCHFELSLPKLETLGF